MNQLQKLFVNLFQSSDAMNIDDKFIRYFNSEEEDLDPTADPVWETTLTDGDFDESIFISQQDFQNINLLDDGYTFKLGSANISFHTVKPVMVPVVNETTHLNLCGLVILDVDEEGSVVGCIKGDEHLPVVDGEDIPDPTVPFYALNQHGQISLISVSNDFESWDAEIVSDDVISQFGLVSCKAGLSEHFATLDHEVDKKLYELLYRLPSGFVVDIRFLGIEIGGPVIQGIGIVDGRVVLLDIHKYEHSISTLGVDVRAVIHDYLFGILGGIL